MNIPPSYSLPTFCCRSQSQSDQSRNLRITAIVIGTLLLLVGVLIMTEMCGGCIDPDFGWTAAIVGGSLIGLASCCFVENRPPYRRDSSSPPIINNTHDHFPDPVDIDQSNLRTAESYLQRGQRESAFIVIKKLSFLIEKKEAFLVKLAESYFNEGDKKGAFKAIQEIIFDTTAKEKFLVKLANSYYSEGNNEQAFKMIKEIRVDLQAKETFFATLAQSYFDKPNENGVIRILNEVVLTSLVSQLIKSNKNYKFNSTINFSNQLAILTTEIYQEVKTHFTQNTPLKAIQFAQKKASEEQVVQRFVNL